MDYGLSAVYIFAERMILMMSLKAFLALSYNVVDVVLGWNLPDRKGIDA